LKHPKKKKNKKQPNPDDSKKTDLPPTEPVVDETDKGTTQKKIDKLFWIRVSLAVIGGISATFLLEPLEGEERRWASIGMMIVIFIITVGIAKGMHIQLPSSDRKKIITTGIGSYIFIYLFMWILSYTIVFAGVNGGLISNPFT
jgi:hypothetical protein